MTAEDGEEDGEVVADVVDVLLGVYELSERGGSIVCEEVVLDKVSTYDIDHGYD